MAVVGRGSAIFDLSIPVSAASPGVLGRRCRIAGMLGKVHRAHTLLSPLPPLNCTVRRPSDHRAAHLKHAGSFIDALFYFLQCPLHCDWNWRNTASTSANQQVPLCSFPTNQRAQHFLLQTLWAWQTCAGSLRTDRMREAFLSFFFYKTEPQPAGIIITSWPTDRISHHPLSITLTNTNIKSQCHFF